MCVCMCVCSLVPRSHPQGGKGEFGKEFEHSNEIAALAYM